VTVSWDDDGALTLSGEFDVANVELLRAALAHGYGNVVIDCEHLTFIDSTGLHALIELLRSGRTVTVRRPSRPVRRVLETRRARRPPRLPHRRLTVQRTRNQSPETRSNSDDLRRQIRRCSVC
jgi:anti-anti-sigma factor